MKTMKRNFIHQLEHNKKDAVDATHKMPTIAHLPRIIKAKFIYLFFRSFCYSHFFFMKYKNDSRHFLCSFIYLFFFGAINSFFFSSKYMRQFQSKCVPFTFFCSSFRSNKVDVVLANMHMILVEKNLMKINNNRRNVDSLSAIREHIVWFWWKMRSTNDCVFLWLQCMCISTYRGYWINTIDIHQKNENYCRRSSWVVWMKWSGRDRYIDRDTHQHK